MTMFDWTLEELCNNPPEYSDLRDRYLEVCAERDKAQEAAERFRTSMYALEERVAELTRERDQWKKLAESRAFDEFNAEIDG